MCDAVTVRQDAEVSKRGIVEVDAATGRVTAFKEKPAAAETASRLACPAVYVLRQATLAHVHTYLDQPEVRGDRDAADAPGRLLQWLVPRTPVHGTRIDGRHDVGNLADYR
jgi:UTP-glucose-1-phosphate uridylyltransferase